MCGDTCAETSNRVCANGFAYQVAVAQTVEHGGVRAEVAAPAHTHGGENGNGVVGYNACVDK